MPPSVCENNIEFKEKGQHFPEGAMVKLSAKRANLAWNFLLDTA
mgnify:CR=1 FL=1|jgi:hypothetical protein